MDITYDARYKRETRRLKNASIVPKLQKITFQLFWTLTVNCL